MSYRLGILDQSPIFSGNSSTDALQHTIRLAQQAEQWGYKRFWVSEHHDTELLAGSSPELLISHLLAKTETIRVGSGGVMLQHYSPYKVAENFNLLSSLAPGRVDLGIGKAPGGLPVSTKALNFGSANQGIDFNERIGLLNDLLEGTVADSHPLAGVKATPIPPEKTENYLLGASPESAELAANLGWNFVYALFINSDRKTLEKAAAAFHGSSKNGRLFVAAAVVAADTEEEAERLAGDKKIYKVHLQSGKSVTVVSAESAQAFGKQAGEAFTVTTQEANILKGTPQKIHEIFGQLHRQFNIAEFIIHTPIEKQQERLRSFELLSPIHSNIKKEETVYVY
ncbi:MsnO8 family LLM class oxidoreductase [Planomicrobium sp. CPCC 101110]|uniref:MsnO8 family LLM class oxidoreductase n=1 Tax=Planomicrobium sp. CPCC 101110 TaxID=2599619 RepID=UPI0011B3B059|nr:MsnO8 family LLM class oxidoreductase [Planomicrobium sp. CPCC 101110]TWT25193.1 MsnO8 family LLM class oxidoreductase [Planomicrobium sp. CPCC 101110]